MNQDAQSLGYGVTDPTPAEVQDKIFIFSTCVEATLAPGLLLMVPELPRSSGTGNGTLVYCSIFFFPSNWRLANQVLFSWDKALGLGLAALFREKNLSEPFNCLVW